MKKRISLLLATIMLCSTFVACGDTGGSTSTPISPTSSTPAVQPSGDVPSWKANADKPVTLEWFVGYDWASATFDPVNNLADKKILEETGITLTYSYGNLDKLNMLITTDSLPDIVTYDANSSARLAMENGGLVLPLDELKAQYAPDFIVPKNMDNWYRNEKDDKWYAFTSYYYDVEDTEARGGYLSSHNMNFARLDIMNQLSIKPEDMHTKDGFIEALKKVKAAKIEYNGQVVQPYIGTDVSFLSEQFGIDRETPDGKYADTYKQPETLEALLFLNRIYSEGLMTDEVFTMDQTLRKQLVSSGHVFSGTTSDYMDGITELFHTDNNALMVGFGLFKGDGNKEAIITPSPTGGWTGTLISKHCKNPDRAVQLFAYLSQPERSQEQEYGGPGGYDIINGEAVLTAERKAEREADPDAFKNKYVNSSQGYFCDWVNIQLVEAKTNLDASQKAALETRQKYQDGRYYDDKIFRNVLPDGGSELATLSAQIDAYWAEQSPLIIMAKTPEEATKIYNDAVTQMDAMGRQRLVEYYDGRFQQNKEKMNAKFAWPRYN